MANGITPNVLGAVQQGLGVRQQLGQAKQQRLAAQQQELLGGLRRTGLGLAPGQRQDVRRQAAEIGPEAIANLDKAFSQFDAPRLESLKEDNRLMSVSSASVLGLPPEQRPAALQQLSQQFANTNNPKLSQGAARLSQLEPEELEIELINNQNLGRQVENVIASTERKAVKLADQSNKDIDADLKKSKNKFEMTDKLRSRVETSSKDFAKSTDAFNRVESLFAKDPALVESFFEQATKNDPTLTRQKFEENAAAFGDMALVFSFMKVNDPTSTVREGEFATAKNTGGVEERFINMYNQALSGQILTEGQRQGIRLQATKLQKGAQAQNEKRLKKFKKSADAFGLDKTQIFDIQEEAAPTGEILNADEQAELDALEAELGNT